MIAEVPAPPTPRRRRRRPPRLRGPALVGIIVLVLWALVALTLPLWSPSDPLEPVADRLLGPSWSHLMGTDALGRDVFIRMTQLFQQQIVLRGALEKCVDFL